MVLRVELSAPSRENLRHNYRSATSSEYDAVREILSLRGNVGSGVVEKALLLGR